MVDHTGTTNLVDICYLTAVETNYAGGKAGAKYAKTASTSAADFTGMNFPNGEQQMPYVTYERERLKVPGQGVDYRIQFTKAYKYNEMVLKVYPQVAKWFNLAFAAITPGTLPGSDYIKYNTAQGNGVTTVDAFGCVLTKYVLTASKGEFPTEELTFNYYDVTQGATAVNKGFTLTQPAIFKDIKATMDGTFTDLTQIESIELTVEFTTLEDSPAAKYQRFDPQVTERKVTLKLTFYDTSATIAGYMDDPRTEASTLIDNVGVAFTNTAINRKVIMTDMQVIESTSSKIPEYGLYKHEITLENAGDSTYTLGAYA